MTCDPGQILNRQIRQTNPKNHLAGLRRKRVLVTGAGGSIGSHLSDWLVRYHDAPVCLLDRHDGNLFTLQERVRPVREDVSFVLADVTDWPEIFGVVERFMPDVIIHAAAYKHVPMLENQYQAAHKNNVRGTVNTIRARNTFVPDCRFVLVSTDKAVDHQSVMGRTKRMAEKYTLQNNNSTVVRFGNVYGSSNSVIEIWERQARAGQDITVTDPTMTRYFMTFDEAAALVLSSAWHPEAVSSVCIADMGEPVNVMDMACRFAEAFGVGVKVVGKRPGEKQHESLAHEGESCLRL